MQGNIGRVCAAVVRVESTILEKNHAQRVSIIAIELGIIQCDHERTYYAVRMRITASKKTWKTSFKRQAQRLQASYTC